MSDAKDARELLQNIIACIDQLDQMVCFHYILCTFMSLNAALANLYLSDTDPIQYDTVHI